MSAVADRDVLLDAVLRPSPPLSPRVLLVILAIVSAINIAFATSFVLRGAWPIAPFLGADVLLLAWAFRTSTIAAAREEHVTLTPSRLSLTRRPAQKDAPDVALNPYWVRVELGERLGRTNQLTLWSHGKGVPVGSFLAPAERTAFARRLNDAIWRAKNFRV